MKNNSRQPIAPLPFPLSTSDSDAVLALGLRLVAPKATIVPSLAALAFVASATRGAIAAGRGRGLLRRGHEVVRINECPLG
jgi:hypothetical protein